MTGTESDVSSLSSNSKTCTSCGFEKILSDFGKRNDTRDGRRSQCKDCRNAVNGKWQKSPKAKAYASQWVKDNPDKVKAYSDKYWKKNPDKLKAKRAKGEATWRKRYPEKAKAKSAKWRNNNPDKIKEIGKRFRESHPNKSRDDANRRRAKIQGVESVKYTEQDIFELWGTDCYLCSKPINLKAARQVGKKGWQDGLHLEHLIPITKNGPDTPQNVRPAHGLCNLKKGSNPYYGELEK